MIRRDFLSKYRQTILGPAWYIIQPLITASIFTVIFGRLAGIPTDGVPQFLFYQCGLLGFSLSSQVFSATATSFTSNAGLYTKVYFPRLIPPISASLLQLVPFAIQLLSFSCFWIYFKTTNAAASFHLSNDLLLLPLATLQLIFLGLGLGLLTSSLTAKYRDLSHMTAFLVQIWMYISPVIYPLSEVPEKYQFIAALNPASASIEIFRSALLGTNSASVSGLGISSVLTAIILICGFFAFQRTERTFVDTV
jgi:lipopolysaccharide transport system permease protein